MSRIHSQFKYRPVLRVKAPHGTDDRALLLQALVLELETQSSLGTLAEWMNQAMVEKFSRDYAGHLHRPVGKSKHEAPVEQGRTGGGLSKSTSNETELPVTTEGIQVVGGELPPTSGESMTQGVVPLPKGLVLM